MRPFAIQGEWLTPERLHDEITHHAAIIFQHARAVSIENSRHTHLHPMHALVIKTKRFSDALAFVVGCEYRWCSRNPDNFPAGDALQDPHTPHWCANSSRAHATGQAKHVVCAQKTGFGRFDWIELVMHRRSWTSQMPNAIHLKLDRLGDIVADQFKTDDQSTGGCCPFGR